MPSITARPALRLGLAAGLALLLGVAHAGRAEELAACDADPHQRLLRPVADTGLDARGHWLGAGRLLWAGPAADPEGGYALVHSRDGRLVVAAGRMVGGADAVLPLRAQGEGRGQGDAAWIGAGQLLELPAAARARLPELLRGQLLLVQRDGAGRVLRATGLQLGPLLDELYAAAERVPDLGVSLDARQTRFKLWAPTARRVLLCRHAGPEVPAAAVLPLRRDTATGIWSLQGPPSWRGGYYSYLVEVQVPGVGRVLNRVTDPYAVSLNADSRRAYIADLADPALKPPGWDALRPPARVRGNTDMVVYELHVRDFSRDDTSVPADKRGRYEAFAERGTLGMRHLQRLSEAGLTDVHLLPVFDIASVPERGCAMPAVPPDAAPDGEAQQAAVAAVAARDCFNWGYDPFHFNAPEGSYASDANDGARRILEFRRMVQGLAGIGLRTGMDVVYNHMAAAGQHPHSVLDRIVPGYYQRYDPAGRIERSTCCDNTATERLMMGKLMLDSVLLWAREYKIASFRFDLMAHQPRALMERLQARLRAEIPYPVPLIGEGWNFGEVANGARFVQASQLSLNGSGIGTFSDRGRDALRGGGASDGGADMVRRQGWLNGQLYAPNELGGRATRQELLKSADLLRVALAGSLRDYELQTFDGSVKPLAQIDYAGQPAGYVAAPGEVVNYADNHDNQTLFDLNALRLPQDTSREDRARVQLLGMAVTAFSQGVAYFHAGIETLRSKSLDRNSYDSGDWFNRLDWSMQTNFFATGLPPKADNGAHYDWMRPVLANALIKPEAAQIRWTAAAFADLLRIRAGSTLFRLDSATQVKQRLRLHNTGPEQIPTLLVGELDGRGLEGAGFERLLYFINAGTAAAELELPTARGLAYALHPVHLAPAAADRRPAEQAAFDPASGRFRIPARTALVYALR